MSGLLNKRGWQSYTILIGSLINDLASLKGACTSLKASCISLRGISRSLRATDLGFKKAYFSKILFTKNKAHNEKNPTIIEYII